MKKLLLGTSLGLVVLSPLIGLAAGISTSTLGTSIDTVNTTWYDYFTVMLTNYWPFVVGAIVLLGVLGFGVRMALKFFHII